VSAAMLYVAGLDMKKAIHAAVIEPLVAGGSMDATMKEILDISARD